ncbi:hypothetical protein LARV_03269 [Longilinea arvoryzae]|uniref:Inner membrane protein YgaP-like transmembrane domain-containing protein n=1 Tax=Longilinea arvoryzae TaxID=360412 RepID=A0A0S7BMI6_9CHLR|nr:DUF2892 domain-containing protein [Longilinea arvoryzae]GAP15480.1 hypothetical protein LARV_03269 [Longilinea arvoryzae]
MSYINESNIDRIIRVILGVIMLVLGWANILPGALGIVFRYLAFLPLLTGLIGFCPAYAILKIRTNKH